MYTPAEMSLALSELKPLIAEENFEELDAALNRFGLDFVLSNGLMDYCRAQRDGDMVVFLATLNSYNGNSIAQAGLLLACYQSIASARLNAAMMALAPDFVVRRAVEIILQDDKSSCADLALPFAGSADDWALALELLLDHEREEALALLALAPRDNPVSARLELLQQRLKALKPVLHAAH